MAAHDRDRQDLHHPTPVDAAPAPTVCSIIPDALLTRIATSTADVANRERAGGRTLRQSAAETLELSHSLRVARIGRAETRRRITSLRRARRQLLRQRLARAAAGCDKNRTIYDAEETQRLPGTKVRGEGDPPTDDPSVNEAYDYFGDTLDFYCSAYDRNSIDDEGLPLVGTVNYGRDFDNAFWNGTQMVFGKGDGELFNTFTSSVDVIGHELTHGVVDDECGLIYFRQPGALNEHLADVFGSLVKQFTLNQTADEADWLIGAELFTDQVQAADGFPGPALRSMRDPGKGYDDPVLGQDPQPAHMDDYVETFSDSGGVHINSGIPNHAFYLAATDLGGHAWEEAGLIWYETMISPQLTRTAQFTDFADVTVLVAGLLFGVGSDQQDAVQNAWEKVGVL